MGEVKTFVSRCTGVAARQVSLITRISSRANPDSKVSDLRALFDSYRFSFSISGRIYVETPLFVGIRPPTLALPSTLDDCEGTLDRWCPTGLEPPNARWPFWVDADLQWQFLFKSDDKESPLIQEFLFEPGRRYERETVRGFRAVLE